MQNDRCVQHKQTMTKHAIPDIPAAEKMAALIRAKDWSKTVLGPAESWPPSLTTAIVRS
jgi:hypothetical protein